MMPVNVNIQTSESRNINFLGRKRIKQKDELFKAFLIENLRSKHINNVENVGT